MKSNLGRESGFGLIEIMIAVGLVSVLLLGIVSLTTNSQKAARGVAQSVDFTGFVSNALQTLNDPVMCTNAFTLPAPAQVLPAIGATGPAVLRVAGSSISTGTLYGALKFTDVSFKDIQDFNPVIPGKNLAKIHVVVDHKNTATGENRIGGSIQSYDFNVVFGFDAARNITQCASANDAAFQMNTILQLACEGMGGVYDGTQPPSSRCAMPKPKFKVCYQMNNKTNSELGPEGCTPCTTATNLTTFQGPFVSDSDGQDPDKVAMRIVECP